MDSEAERRPAVTPYCRRRRPSDSETEKEVFYDKNAEDVPQGGHDAGRVSAPAGGSAGGAAEMRAFGKSCGFEVNQQL